MFISDSNHNPTPITATTSKQPPSSLDFSADHHHNDMLIEVGPTHHHRLPSLGTTPSSSGPKKRAETWVQDETRNLISLRREMDSLFNTSKSNKHLREQISAKMRDRGFDRSPTMCTDNWRNFLKEFKKPKQQMGNAGNGNAKMLCYKEIEEILRDRSRCASNSAGYKSPNYNSNDGVNHSSKVDSFFQFSDKGIDDASIPFGPIEANGRPTLNLERRLDHERLPLAITAADGVTDGGCPPSFWRETPGNGDDTHPFGGRVITFKFGDYTKRIGIEGTACTLDPAKFGAANDIIDRGDNHVMSIEGAADIYEAPCVLEVSKFGTSNCIVDRDDDNHGKSTEAAANTDTISAAPHPALSYVLAFLGVRDLLSVERVCKSLCHTVRNDPILWRNIHIDNPLHEKITDDILLQLTNRAQGSLHCLNLMNCQRISDDGLKRVLLSNPRMTKLSVPGCTRLSNDGVVNCLRAFKMVAVNGIKFLRFGGRVGVTQRHFEELMSLLDTGNQVKNNRPKPHFYHRGNLNISYEDDRPIDLEMCPRCQNMRLVYDCPVDSCQGKNHAAELCKACTLCIARCYECGKCINDDCVYEETFSLDSLCSDCWNHIPHFPDVGIILPQHVIDQEPSAFSDG